MSVPMLTSLYLIFRSRWLAPRARKTVSHLGFVLWLCVMNYPYHSIPVASKTGAIFLKGANTRLYSVYNPSTATPNRYPPFSSYHIHLQIRYHPSFLLDPQIIMREHSVPAPPRFASLIQNPSPEERLFLLDALSAPEMALKAMRMEISQLTTRLKTLVDEERQLTEKLGPYRAVLSPFRALPDDILREIFLACIPTDTNPLVDPRHAPILLTHISRHTRHIALTTARLWVAIHVSIEHSENRIGRQIEVVAEWIRRSGIYTHRIIRSMEEDFLHWLVLLSSTCLPSCSRIFPIPAAGVV
ncbi:hypothetical protein HYPSUDRAFT_289752 [Hypholoma sublateritium FD-334 SS-4]|uniref:F-box domain-containing protein n=1 Tax=Hypholoma sublateritium (strain FD-334 SS-4) TaxID=945553 RepID=A0A0D2P888_HYPSF|nr:hypothetical protein HYPSUDRAFT_289752 [Hypholoma sublateritium FD-334 SS-4]